MSAVISIKYNSWYKMAEIVGILAMGIHTWMRIFYFCSAGQQVTLENRMFSYAYLQVQDSATEIVQELSYLKEGYAQVTRNGGKDYHDLTQECSGHMKRLEARGRLSARGYFTVERGLITSVLGTSLTYMVILIQFWETTTQIE